MHVLITTTGSHGDVHPFLAVGIALARRGHDVTMVVNGYYRQLVLDEGLRFVPIGEEFDLRQLSDFPDVMHQWRGPQIVVNQLMIPYLMAAWERLPRLLERHRPDIVL